MVKQISNKVSNLFFQWEVFEEDRLETFAYCFEVVFMLGIFLLLTLPIAYFVELFFPTVLFLVVFLLLRSVAGGFHTKTAESCILLSIATVYVFLAFMKSDLFAYVPVLFLIIYALSCTIIFMKAPVEAANYPLSPQKRKRHRTQCIYLLVLFSMTFIVLLFKTHYIVAQSIFMAVFITSISMIITK